MTSKTMQITTQRYLTLHRQANSPGCTRPPRRGPTRDRVSGGLGRMWRVARVSSVRLRVTGVNDGIEEGMPGPAGGAAAGSAGARAGPPQRTRAAAGATRTHGSGCWCDQNAWERGWFSALSCVRADIWPKRKKAAGSAVAVVRFGGIRRRSRAFGRSGWRSRAFGRFGRCVQPSNRASCAPRPSHARRCTRRATRRPRPAEHGHPG